MQEPWLREQTLPCHPAIAAVIFALQQAEEDLERFHPPRAAYFHLRHIAQSLERLTTYLNGQALSESQLAALHSEQTASGESLEMLIAQCRQAFAQTREVLLRFPSEELAEARYVGRNRIPTTAIGLIIHIAEHTQRHIGQIIAYSRVG